MLKAFASVDLHRKFPFRFHFFWAQRRMWNLQGQALLFSPCCDLAYQHVTFGIFEYLATAWGKMYSPPKFSTRALYYAVETFIDNWVNPSVLTTEKNDLLCTSRQPCIAEEMTFHEPSFFCSNFVCLSRVVPAP